MSGLSRIKFTPTGITYPADYNLPSGDVSTLGILLSDALQDLSVAHVFMPNKLTVKTHGSVVGGRDLGANDAWYNEGVGDGPTQTTINSLLAWNFTHSLQSGDAGMNAFRLMREDTHTSWAVIGGLEVTAGNLALTNADGPRSMVIKQSSTDASKYDAVQLIDGGDDLVDYWFIVREGVPYNSSVAATTGTHVYCGSFDSATRSLKLYIDSATTAIVSQTVAADKANPITGRWGIGGVPGAGFNWEGPLGYCVILHGALHGTTALDDARLAAMTALANASYGYDVTLT